VSHDRYFLNRVADRLIHIANGQARVIEGDYETFQHLLQKEKTRDQKAVAQTTAAAPAKPKAGSRSGESERPKRKFPYRKAADIEREIGELEREVTEIEDLLGQPATWRDPVKAVRTQDRHAQLKTKLEQLYQHWETALEANW
jgi:ATP-binding cassette subfamily F protein 3